MKGWIEISIGIHGTGYYPNIWCCETGKLKHTKSRDVKSWNSQKDYYKCSKCGQQFMIQHQEFICSHNDRKKTNDLNYRVFIKK